MNGEMAQNRPSTSQNNGIKNLVPFAPGVSGNPGGRPKTAHISEALRQKLDSDVDDGSSRTFAQAIADRACNAAAFAKRESQAVQAAEFIADRTEGKALQSVRVQHVDEITLKHIADLAERLLGDNTAVASYQSFPHPSPEMSLRELPDVTQCTVLATLDVQPNVPPKGAAHE